METVVGVEGSDEGKLGGGFLEKSSFTLSSPKHIANPVVYKLVRVEGDGSYVPATDDELMEVEGLLEDENGEIPFVVNVGQTSGDMSIEMSSSGMPYFEKSEGLCQSNNFGAGAGKLNARMEYIEEMLLKVKQEERLRLACRSPDHSSAYVNVDCQSSDQHDKVPDIDEELHSQIPLQDTVASMAQNLSENDFSLSETVEECLKPSEGPNECGPSSSASFTSSIPDFSKLKEEICLDNLSIRELHDIFKATFGRDTTVKDKQWLKRRIAMGLTNSCDVSTTTFIIKNNKLLKNGTDQSMNDVNEASIIDPDVGINNCGDSLNNPGGEREERQISLGQVFTMNSMEDNYGGEDLHIEQQGRKRVRKPTKRYIEELDEVESKEYNGRTVLSGRSPVVRSLVAKPSVRPARNDNLERRTFTTRLDSLGGYGVQVPCVSRVRRSRPRKNFVDLLKLHPGCDMGLTATLLRTGPEVHCSETDNEDGDKVFDACSELEQIPQQFIAEPCRKMASSSMDSIDGELILEEKQVDPVGYPSDDNVNVVPTAKGGIRRKHHRAWTLSEVMKLVEGVSKYGAGRWSEIKRLAFASYSYRTSVDLKDKWRNLLRASFAQTPDKAVNSRKHPSLPIPTAILLRVRELAEMQAQDQPHHSTSKLVTSRGRSVHEAKAEAGYL